MAGRGGGERRRSLDSCSVGGSPRLLDPFTANSRAASRGRASAVRPSRPGPRARRPSPCWCGSGGRRAEQKTLLGIVPLSFSWLCKRTRHSRSESPAQVISVDTYHRCCRTWDEEGRAEGKGVTRERIFVFSFKSSCRFVAWPRDVSHARACVWGAVPMCGGSFHGEKGDIELRVGAVNGGTGASFERRAKVCRVFLLIAPRSFHPPSIRRQRLP